MATTASSPLLEIRHLELEFVSGPTSVRVLRDVSFRLDSEKTLCLVGESGCGKSVTGLSIARLIPSPPARYPRGEILLEGRNVLAMSPRELRAARGKMVGYVFQEPAVCLNPVMTVGQQILESLAPHQPRRANLTEVVRLLSLVGISAPESRVRNYPHQLSGGMQQRVMIAMAIAPEPRLLVADEPTTALDVTVQAQILDLLRDLRQRLGMAMLLITHNLAIVNEIADDVAVMYAGQIVEYAPAENLLAQPLHPYTRALKTAAPALGGAPGPLAAIPGRVPAPGEISGGCRFQPRCAFARPACATNDPPLSPGPKTRWVRCPYWADIPVSTS